MSEDLKITARSRSKRGSELAQYDRETVYEILDAGFICHVGYVIDGAPHVTPTIYWRNGNRIYWHGSSASRAIKSQDASGQVCLSVTHFDGIVLARSAFHHSANYRSVMLFGEPQMITDRAELETALKRLMDRIAPERWAEVRGPSDQEAKATSVLWMEISEGAAKIRTGGAKDEPEDLGLQAWAGVVPVNSTLGDPVPNDDLDSSIETPDYIAQIKVR